MRSVMPRVACTWAAMSASSNCWMERHVAMHARCVVTSEIERSVAFGGFAAEFFLLNNGHAQQRSDDDRDISQVVFHNATGDREEFGGRKLDASEAFTVEQDEAFMRHATKRV